MGVYVVAMLVMAVHDLRAFVDAGVRSAGLVTAGAFLAAGIAAAGVVACAVHAVPASGCRLRPAR